VRRISIPDADDVVANRHHTCSRLCTSDTPGTVAGGLLGDVEAVLDGGDVDQLTRPVQIVDGDVRDARYG
jgi:hypothetical protein